MWLVFFFWGGGQSWSKFSQDIGQFKKFSINFGKMRLASIYLWSISWPSVCLLATSCWLNLHDNSNRGPVQSEDKEEVIKFCKLSGISCGIHQHCKTWHFATTWLISLEKPTGSISKFCHICIIVQGSLHQILEVIWTLDQYPIIWILDQYRIHPAEGPHSLSAPVPLLMLHSLLTTVLAAWSRRGVSEWVVS